MLQNLIDTPSVCVSPRVDLKGLLKVLDPGLCLAVEP